ncbi:MAG: hypothetical protein INF45_04060 [Rhodobacter sp.]|nr:hypothetical protein [Rhodobacter sp.]
MGGTKTAGFRPKSYKTLQSEARKTVPFQHKINGMGIVQGELDHFGVLCLRAAAARDRERAAIAAQIPCGQPPSFPASQPAPPGRIVPLAPVISVTSIFSVPSRSATMPSALGTENRTSASAVLSGAVPVLARILVPFWRTTAPASRRITVNGTWRRDLPGT